MGSVMHPVHGCVFSGLAHPSIENDALFEAAALILIPVQNQYGRAIKQSVLDTLSKLGIENAEVDVNDRGALECTLRARVECAVYRSAGVEAGIPWEEM